MSQVSAYNAGLRADWALHNAGVELSRRHALGQFDDAYTRDWQAYDEAVSLQRRGWPSPVPISVQALLGVLEE